MFAGISVRLWFAPALLKQVHSAIIFVGIYLWYLKV